MGKTIKIVNVYVEKDSITCECICALPDVSEGDYVQIFLNNSPTTGEVKALREIALNEMTDAMYEMKSVIKKMPNPNKGHDLPRNTINVSEIINRNRAITLIGMGIAGKLVFSDAEVESFKAEPGDILYFADYEGTKFRTAILKIENSNDASESRIHIDAIKKDSNVKTFYDKNQYSLDFTGDDKKVTLKAFLIKEEEYVIGDWISHIGAKSFERNRKLKKLVIDTVGVDIEPLAFAYNESIEEIIIKDERASINVNSFDGCRNLKRVILPYELYYLRYELEEYYGDKIQFEYELGNNILKDGVVYSKKYETIICCVDEEIEEYKAPLYTKYIRYKAFLNCKKLQKFYGSPFMEDTGYKIFSGCMSLKEVNYRFKENYDVILMFGEDYCEDANVERVSYKDGTERLFYLPKECKYINIPDAEEVLKDVKPEDIEPDVCHFIAEYYSSIHKIKEAVRFHSVAARQGYEDSYQKLAEYVQTEDVRSRYFTLDLFDYADRTQSLKPFFLMLSRDYPEYNFEDYTNNDILDEFEDIEKLKKLLKTIASSSIYDTDIMNVVLNKLYMNVEDELDHVLKVLFLKCANKIGDFDNVLYWMDDVLEEIFVSESDYREFAFNKLPIMEFIHKPEKDEFVSSMPECETKECIKKAFFANQNPGAGNVELFEEFLKKAKETNDMFYQKCAVLTMCSYISLCWREKSYAAEFRKVLELILERYNDGFDLVGALILSYKQNMKKSITKRFYRECAEKLYDQGVLYSNIFDNLLGENVQESAAFFCKYPEFFDLEDRDRLVMKELNRTYYYVWGTMVQKPVNSKKDPILYLNYVPELIDDELVLFLNPHEAMTYMKKKNMAAPNDLFRIPIGHVLSILLSMNLDYARVFPRTLNQKISREYIEHIYDRRI